jgi:hypothetical protein
MGISRKLCHLSYRLYDSGGLMERPMVLMTTHGSLLCTGATGLYHVAMDALSDADTPLLVNLHETTRNERHARMLTRTNTPLTITIPGLPPGCEMLIESSRRTATLLQNRYYYSAEPMRRVLANDRSNAGLWESFLFVTEDDFAAIKHIFGNDWIRASSKQVCRAASIRFREGFILAIGDLELDLRYNLPFLPHNEMPALEESGAMSFNVLIDGWKIERIHLYRPFIYFTAFGSPYALEQAYTAIASLIEFGGYDGHVHVITDQPAESFLQNIPSLLPERITVQNLASQDWVGYVAAKYCILDWVYAYNFQPLLFLDTDVVCDAPLEPLLATIVALDRMSAPLEDVSSLQTNPSVGASLIQRSGLDARFACGVNGGTVGIPNLRGSSEIMELTRTIITNHSEIFGRDHFRWVDQEVLNYVSFCVGNFDSSALLRFIRYGWENDEFDATRRLGLVHFWPPVADRPKLDRMKDYIQSIRTQMT